MDHDLEAEQVKLEVLFANEGRLRSLIPHLLKEQLYYDRIFKWSNDRNRLIDILVRGGIKTGDSEAIFDLLEDEKMKKKKENVEEEEAKNNDVQQKKTKKLEIIAIDQSETIFSSNNHG